jgi:hypothetical protein
MFDVGCSMLDAGYRMRVGQTGTARRDELRLADYLDYEIEILNG